MSPTKLLAVAAAAAALLAACDHAPTAARSVQGPSRTMSIASNQPPTASFTWAVLQKITSGPCTGAYRYRYDGSVSSDPDGTISSYAWYENGTLKSTSAVYQPTYLRGYTTAGSGTEDGWLVVTDNLGAQDTTYFSYTPTLSSC